MVYHIDMLSETKDFNATIDGGSRGNPGHSASAFCIVTENNITTSHGRYIGIQTNNFAEYMALSDLVDWLIEHKAKTCNVLSDSKLVVETMSMRWVLKNEALYKIRSALWVKLAQAEIVLTIAYVPREQNKAADAVVNRVLDAQNKKEHEIGEKTS